MATAQHVRYEDLKAGDHIVVTHRIKVGLKIWHSKTTGTVLKTERRRNGLHVDRSDDDKAYQDVIVMQSDTQPPDETTVTLDEFTLVERG